MGNCSLDNKFCLFSDNTNLIIENKLNLNQCQIISELD